MAGAFISIMLLIVARHHPPSRRKIKEIWHGRVYWESNTTMLRSSPEKALGSIEPSNPSEPSTNLGSIEPSTNLGSIEPSTNLGSIEPSMKLDALTPKVNLLTVTKPMVAICAATHSKSTWRSLGDTALQNTLIPSIEKTISTSDRSQYDFRLYLAADHDDQFWLNNQNNVKTPDWLSVHVGFYEVPKHKIPFNPMMRAAFNDGAEYLVRINDDSEFVTSDWVSKAVANLASYDPPNVGMVGPNCREGNTAIMTHDMVHRTHLDIFEHYYPDVFSAWWIDDWISKVYGPQRSTKMMDWTVKHHTHKHGTRYEVQHHEAKLLEGELEKGAAKIEAWLLSSTEPVDLQHKQNAVVQPTDAKPDILNLDDPNPTSVFTNARWTLLLTVNNDYMDLFINFMHWFQKLKLDIAVTVIAEDVTALKSLRKLKLPENVVVRASDLIVQSAPSGAWNTPNYNKLVSKRPHYIVNMLKSGTRVLYADIDSVWLSSPLSYWDEQADIMYGIDHKNNDHKNNDNKNNDNGINYCSGFMFITPNKRTINFFEEWQSRQANGTERNQHIFNELLRVHTEMRQKVLPENAFPAGHMYFNSKRTKGAVVVHNNYIIGHDAKVARFKAHHFWLTEVCLRTPSTRFGRTGNRILQLANALILAKEGFVLLDKSQWSWFNNLLEPHPQIMFVENAKQKCDKTYETYEDYSKLHFLFDYHTIHPRLAELRLRSRYCDAARTAYPNAFVSVHRRHLEGTCESLIKKHYTFCTNNREFESIEPCNWRQDSFHENNIVLFTDNQRNVFDKSFTKQSHLPFEVELCAMTLSNAHYGNPASSIDYIISHWRNHVGMYPSDCWSTPELRNKPLDKNALGQQGELEKGGEKIEKWLKKVQLHKAVDDAIINPESDQQPENSEPPHLKTNNYIGISAFIKNINPKLCSHAKILKGTSKLEPDVRICMPELPCVVYSFGIANNWLFDDMMLDHGCSVWSFDPSMKIGKHSRRPTHLFEPIGIGATSGTHKGASTLYGGKNDYMIMTLEDLMKKYGHTHIDIVRMDTETAEWDVLAQWNRDNTWSQFDQLLMEIHLMRPASNSYNSKALTDPEVSTYTNILQHIPFKLFHSAQNKDPSAMVNLYNGLTRVYEVGLIKTKPSLIISGVARDVYAHQDTVLKTIREQQNHFNIIKIVVYENDSKDDTLKGLHTWQDKLRIPVDIISEKKVGGNRVERISRGRNAILVALDKISSPPDFLLIIDLDSVNANLKGVQTCLDMEQPWGACCANQRDSYYDLWALRTFDDWCDCDVWNDAECAKTREAKFRHISSDNDPIEVKSCFGGAALYDYTRLKTLVKQGARYDSDTCEHVSFHKHLRKQDDQFKLFIQPKMLNDGEEKHVPLSVRNAKAPNDATKMTNVFEKIYNDNTWSSRESLSGEGSEMKVTRSVRKCLSTWIKKYNIKSFGDICGDANWQGSIEDIGDLVEYRGYDVSKKALERAAKKNTKHQNFRFQQIDISVETPTSADAFMIRDVIQHIPLDLGVSALNNIIQAGVKYLIVSSYPKTLTNNNIKIGDYYRNNVYKAPFDSLKLPQPIETCENYDDRGDDKCCSQYDAKLLLIKLTNPLPESTFKIIILTQRRHWSLKRLLNSLNAANYAGHNVHIEIRVDKHDSEDHQKTLEIARAFKFEHGSVDVHESTQTRGLQYVWFDAWTPKSETERAIILEDDLEVSPLWFIWLQQAWTTYGSRDDLGSISICKQPLRASDGGQIDKQVDAPFMYRMIGSWGFSPNARYWKPFVEWVRKVDIKTINIDVVGTVSTAWHKASPTSWEQFYIWWCNKYSLYAMYVHPRDGALVAHWGEPGVHYSGKPKRNVNLIRQTEPALENFPTELVHYGWDFEPEKTSLDQIADHVDLAVKKNPLSVRTRLDKNINPRQKLSIESKRDALKIMSATVFDKLPGRDHLYFSYSTKSKLQYGWNSINHDIHASKEGCLHGIYHCKVQDMLNYLLTNPFNEHDLVFFYDAFDVIFFQTPQTTVERWGEMIDLNKWNGSEVVLFNAETNCFPESPACAIERELYSSSATHIVPGAKEKVYYLNSGMYIGTIGAVTRMLRSANTLFNSGGKGRWNTDQHVFHELCYTGTSRGHLGFKCELDVSQTIFRTGYPYSNSGKSPGKTPIVERWTKIASEAVAVHFNGKDKINGDYAEWLLKNMAVKKNPSHVECKTITLTEERQNTVLLIENAHVEFANDNIILRVSSESFEHVQKTVNECKITGYVKKKPKIIVQKDDNAQCSDSTKDTVLVDSEFWGAYGHTTTDHIVPWFVTSRIFEMVSPTIQWYGKDNFKSPTAPTEQNLLKFGKCLDLDIIPKVNVAAGCYRKVSVGYLYTFRPVIWPHVEAKDLKIIPKLKPWLQLAHRKLYKCYKHSDASTPTNNWSLVKRKTGNTERVLHFNSDSNNPVSNYVSVVEDLIKGVPNIKWHTINRLIAVEGSLFANQWLMPSRSKLVIIHLPRETLVSMGIHGYVIWFTSLAMYLDNSVVDVVMPSPEINTDKLAALLSEAENISGNTRCISQNLELPLQCGMSDAFEIKISNYSPS